MIPPCRLAGGYQSFGGTLFPTASGTDLSHFLHVIVSASEELAVFVLREQFTSDELVVSEEPAVTLKADLSET
jgi:hypothetical protein